MSAITVYTIGHSNHPSETLLDLLDQHHIRVLLDVRSTPYSRHNPQYNRETIKATVEAHGLEYRYAADYLGGRPKDPTLLRTADDPPNDDSWGYPDVNYGALMRSEHYQRGITRLLELAADSRVAVMCSEGNPLDCHRHHLIARSLVDPLVKVTNDQVVVMHIKRDGTLEAVKPDDFKTQLPLF
jgi:uncharacterized protein (DUF488 family)